MSDELPTQPAPALTDQALKQISNQLNQILFQIRRHETAVLAAALITNRRKSITIPELLDITRDVHFAKYPMPHHPEYQEWEQTKDERLNRVYK